MAPGHATALPALADASATAADEAAADEAAASGGPHEADATRSFDPRHGGGGSAEWFRSWFDRHRCVIVIWECGWLCIRLGWWRWFSDCWWES